MSSTVKIDYTGTEASCILEADATAGTLTAKIGDAGSESADPAFGTAGVIDLAADVETLTALVSLVDAYDDYSAALYSGEGGTDPEVILDATVQAKGVSAYLLFVPDSVLSEYALVTWARAQEMLGYGASDQTMIERLINATTELAESQQYAGVPLAARDYTSYLPGPGGDRLILPYIPVNSVSALYTDTSREFGSDTEIESSNYELDGDAGIIYLFDGLTFPEARKSIKITYNAGYDPIPEDLQLAALEAVSWNLSRFRSKTFGIRTQSNPAGLETSMELTIPVNAQRVFESYRDRRYR